jgi:hypothetical protein
LRLFRSLSWSTSSRREMRETVRSLALGALAMAIGQIHPVRAEEIGRTKTFQLTGPRASFATVGASPEGWMAAGAKIIVVSRNGRLESTRDPGRTTLGLASTSDGVFGLGLEQLILHLDGDLWVDEHLVPRPSASMGRQRSAAIPYGNRLNIFRSGDPLPALVRRSPNVTFAQQIDVLPEHGYPLAGVVTCAWNPAGRRGATRSMSEASPVVTGKPSLVIAQPKPCSGRTPRRSRNIRTSLHQHTQPVALIFRCVRPGVIAASDENTPRAKRSGHRVIPGARDPCSGGPTCLYAVTNRSVWASCVKSAGKSKM